MSTLAANASVRRTSPPQAAAPTTFQAWSVLIVSTLAFTVCFMVWMMFGVIGIPIRKMLDLNATEFGLLTATPGADRLADPRAAGHLDRPLRRPHRDDDADGVDRARHLADGLCDRSTGTSW